MEKHMKRILNVRFFAGVSALVIAIALPAAQAQESRKNDGKEVAKRRDVRQLPAPLKSRLVEMAEQPHSYLPLTAFSEAATPRNRHCFHL